jgi:hypothetical protein
MALTPTSKSSRIAAARERAERAKTVLLAAAVIAFFGAMGFEQGAVSHASSQSPAASSSESDEESGLFDQGGLAPAQGAPSTSTGTS